MPSNASSLLPSAATAAATSTSSSSTSTCTTYSIFRSIIVKIEEVKVVVQSNITTTYNDVLTVNVVIKTLKPSAAASIGGPANAKFWQQVLAIFTRLSHLELAKLVLKYVSLNQRAVDSLKELPLLFDLSVRDRSEIESIIEELKLVCSTEIIYEPPVSADDDCKQKIPIESLPTYDASNVILWDPKDLVKSIRNLPNPGKWSQRTSSTTIHVIGACHVTIGAPQDYEIFHPIVGEKCGTDGEEGKTGQQAAPPFRVVYYSDSFFESTCFPSCGDIILLYPGNYYCGWQVKSSFVVPSLEIYGVNCGKHELDLVGSYHYSEMCSDGALIELNNSPLYQPYPIYQIIGNLTMISRCDGRPISVRGGECHLFMFNCFIRAAHYPAILFSPTVRGSLHMRKCFVTGAMDSCLVLGRATSPSNIDSIDVSLKNCKITKSGRGYLTKPGQSPAISVLTLSSLEVENCVVRDNVGHAFQLRGEKKHKPQKVLLKGNVLKRNQACDFVSKQWNGSFHANNTNINSGGDDDGADQDMPGRSSAKFQCCAKMPALSSSTYNSFLSTWREGRREGGMNSEEMTTGSGGFSSSSTSNNRVVVRGRYCFSCGAATRKMCSHCKNAFYCNIQCQLEDWTVRHQYYCVK